MSPQNYPLQREPSISPPLSFYTDEGDDRPISPLEITSDQQTPILLGREVIQPPSQQQIRRKPVPMPRSTRQGTSSAQQSTIPNTEASSFPPGTPVNALSDDQIDLIIHRLEARSRQSRGNSHAGSETGHQSVQEPVRSSRHGGDRDRGRRPRRDSSRLQRREVVQSPDSREPEMIETGTRTLTNISKTACSTETQDYLDPYHQLPRTYLPRQPPTGSAPADSTQATSNITHVTEYQLYNPPVQNSPYDRLRDHNKTPTQSDVTNTSRTVTTAASTRANTDYASSQYTDGLTDREYPQTTSSEHSSRSISSSEFSNRIRTRKLDLRWGAKSNKSNVSEAGTSKTSKVSSVFRNLVSPKTTDPLAYYSQQFQEMSSICPARVRNQLNGWDVFVSQFEKSGWRGTPEDWYEIQRGVVTREFQRLNDFWMANGGA